MSGIQDVPPPWKLRGTSWVFVLSGLSKNASFPAGFAAPNEAEALTEGGEFIGGLGLVQLVSYSESPVGPYDELIYIPGRWKYQNHDPSAAFRITRIYVSTKESTENGRRNWNIPKHLANFDYRKTENGTTVLNVTLPGSSTPFFKATIQPIPLLSYLSVPIASTILGKYFTLIQPPLLQGDNPEEVSTSKWVALTPFMKGKTRIVSLVPGFEDGSVGDGVAFPKVKPWLVGSIMEDVELDFGVPDWFEKVGMN